MHTIVEMILAFYNVIGSTGSVVLCVGAFALIALANLHIYKTDTSVEPVVEAPLKTTSYGVMRDAK